jgi:hypothetical protein
MIKTLLLILAFAQRDYKHIPDDFIDYSNNSGADNFYGEIALIIITIVVLMIYFSVRDSSRKKEIDSRKKFRTITTVFAHLDASKAKSSLSGYTGVRYKVGEDYKEKNGEVCIPKDAECMIIEYLPENDKIVKVKFDYYPSYLYVERRILQEIPKTY